MLDDPHRFSATGTVPEVDAFMRRAGEEIWNLEQLPKDDAGEQDAYSPAGGGAEVRPNTRLTL